MARVFPWLVRLTTAAMVLAAVVIAFVYYVVSRSLPDYDRRVEVAGITAPVEILRDTANVPHIFGQSDADSYFGLGYAHAQDRLWQMTMLRRTAQGKLSEVFGTATIELDEVMRRLDIYTLATQSVGVQTSEVLAALKAYSNGVNARLAEINRGALGRGAPEFFLFTPSISPWQPADSIAIQKIMAL
ncbi:MAG: penicillin acylase family protein, partial [Pseudomonadota bacterium]